MSAQKPDPDGAQGAPQPELGDVPALAPEAAEKKHKYPKPGDGLFWRNLILRMDPKLKQELDQKLRYHSFRSWRALAAWLAECGFTISHQALWKYGNYFHRRLQALKIATAQAKVIVEETGCDSEDVEKALLQLVQTELFNVLVSVQEAKLKLEPSALYAIARATASLITARVSAARLNEQIRKQVDKGVAEALTRVDSERGRGLSPEGAEQIRTALLEIIE
jgi:uncharacterized protein DUF3486